MLQDAILVSDSSWDLRRRTARPARRGGPDGRHSCRGSQLVGQRNAEIAKRVDTYATALYHSVTVAAISDLDLSYSPPLGSPWDAIQAATQAWERENHLAAKQQRLTA